MKIKQIKVLEADENMVLTNGVYYCSSVMLRFDETPDTWSEITQEEYETILEGQKKDKNDGE